MKFIIINQIDLSVDVVEESTALHAVVIPVACLDGIVGIHPGYDAVVDIVYEDEEENLRIKNAPIPYFGPVDPWLAALGVLIWEAVVQGLSWEATRTLVAGALERLRQVMVAPTGRSISVTKSTQTEVMFRWTEYADEKKVRDIYYRFEKKMKG